MARGILLSALLLLCPGCQSLQSWTKGCPGVYSGMRFYGDQFTWLPFDGKIFFTLDLPLSAEADTLALPVTVFADPVWPREGFVPGCRWVKKR